MNALPVTTVPIDFASPTPSSLTDDDRIRRFGYRDVYRSLPDGTTTIDRVPLTLDDLLHPQVGDVAMISSKHDLERDYLANIFRTRLANVPGSLVLSDTMIDWGGDPPGMRHHSPDLMVLLGVREERKTWTSFNVVEQKCRPSLIVEVVSPTYRANDTVTKVEDYLRCRVGCYAIVDREKHDDPPRLVARVLRGNSWRPLAPNDNGWLWLEAVGVYLSIVDQRVRCIHPTTLAVLGDPVENALTLEFTAGRLEAERELRMLAEDRIDREMEARRAAEARVAELESQLRSLQNAPTNPSSTLP